MNFGCLMLIGCHLLHGAQIGALSSNLLRHGMCRMLWSLSLSPIFQDLAALVDKTGRLPKSFASRKVGHLPSPDQAAPFLQAAVKLLDTAIVVIDSSLDSRLLF